MGKEIFTAQNCSPAIGGAFWLLLAMQAKRGSWTSHQDSPRGLMDPLAALPPRVGRLTAARRRNGGAMEMRIERSYLTNSTSIPGNQQEEI